MKFLCLICAERVMEQMPEADAEKHFGEYGEFTEAIRKSGHFIGCNRLSNPGPADRPGGSTLCDPKEAMKYVTSRGENRRFRAMAELSAAIRVTHRFSMPMTNP